MYVANMIIFDSLSYDFWNVLTKNEDFKTLKVS